MKLKVGPLKNSKMQNKVFTWTVLIIALAHFTGYASSQTATQIKCHCESAECPDTTVPCLTDGTNGGCAKLTTTTASKGTTVQKACNFATVFVCLHTQFNIGKTGCNSATGKQIREKCGRRSGFRKDLVGVSQPKESSDTGNSNSSATGEARAQEFEDGDSFEACVCHENLCNKNAIIRGGIGLVMISAVIAAVVF